MMMECILLHQDIGLPQIRWMERDLHLLRGISLWKHQYGNLKLLQRLNTLCGNWWNSKEETHKSEFSMSKKLQHIFSSICEHAQALWRNPKSGSVWHKCFSGIKDWSLLQLICHPHSLYTIIHLDPLGKHKCVGIPKKHLSWRQSLRFAKEDAREWINLEEQLTTYNSTFNGNNKGRRADSGSWKRPPRGCE